MCFITIKQDIKYRIWNEAQAERERKMVRVLCLWCDKAKRKKKKRAPALKEQSPSWNPLTLSMTSSATPIIVVAVVDDDVMFYFRADNRRNADEDCSTREKLRLLQYEYSFLPCVVSLELDIGKDFPKKAKKNESICFIPNGPLSNSFRTATTPKANSPLSPFIRAPRSVLLFQPYLMSKSSHGGSFKDAFQSRQAMNQWRLYLSSYVV